jgi:3-hydroxyacyl-CoA dehydrogenase
LHEDLKQDAKEQADSGARRESWLWSVTHSTSLMAGTAVAVDPANATEFHFFFKQ